MSEEYTLTYHCENCKSNFNKSFSKGSLAGKITICKYCGCETAHKVNRASEQVIPPRHPLVDSHH